MTLVTARAEQGNIDKVYPAGRVGEGSKRQAWVVAGMPRKLFRVVSVGGHAGGLESLHVLWQTILGLLCP
jgi:hypothetical protein